MLANSHALWESCIFSLRVAVSDLRNRVHLLDSTDLLFLFLLYVMKILKYEVYTIIPIYQKWNCCEFNWNDLYHPNPFCSFPSPGWWIFFNLMSIFIFLVVYFHYICLLWCFKYYFCSHIHLLFIIVFIVLFLFFEQT